MSIFNKANILLPECVDMEKWSVVACDQYTAQPEYWKKAEELVGNNPSTLNIRIQLQTIKATDILKK